MNVEDPKSHFRLPAETRWPLFLYNLFFPIVLLGMLPQIALRMFRRGGFRAKFGQRLGHFTPDDLARFAAHDWTWIHSISVGETLLALKLARKMRALDPAQNIAISVTTSTGFAVAQPAVCDWLEVIYNPLDSRAIVRRTLRALRPTRLIFIEAIWPNLLATTKKLGVPTALIARLSPRSERRFRTARKIVAPIFRLLDTVCVQEPEDVARWQSLGVETARIQCTGNIKFDLADEMPSREAEFRSLVRKLGVKDGAPVLLAGSTFPGEEKIVAEIFCDLRPEFPDLFLILVPRHVERSRDILAELQPFGFPITLRTKIHQPQTANTACLLVDTTGELRDWYRLASVVFIGKSLVGEGGQNPVEPIVAGKPVLFGPHMENFAAITQHLLAHGAATQAANAAELKAHLARLLRSPSLRAQMAAKGGAAVAAHQGATERTASLLLRF